MSALVGECWQGAMVLVSGSILSCVFCTDGGVKWMIRWVIELA